MNCRHQKSGDCPECAEHDATWRRIDNALASTAEYQANHALAVEKHDKQMAELAEKMDQLTAKQTVTTMQIQDLGKRLDQLGVDIDKQRENIERFLRGDRPNGKQ